MNIKLIASAAATILTLASMSAVISNLPEPITHVAASGTSAVNLAPVQVYADAADLRAAALLADALPATALLTSPAVGTETGGRVQLLRAAAAMPYYSFGNSLGRINRN